MITWTVREIQFLAEWQKYVISIGCQHFSTEFNCTLHRMKFKLGSTCAAALSQGCTVDTKSIWCPVAAVSKPRASQFSHKNKLFLHSFPLSLGIKVCGYLKRDLVKREGLATLARSVSDNDTFSIQTVVCHSPKELIHYSIVR